MTERSFNNTDPMSNLRLDALVSGERTDVSVSGEIDVTNAHVLDEFLELASRNGSPTVVVDLSECEFVDATGLLPIARLLSHPPEGVRVLIGQSPDSIACLLRACGLDAAILSVLPRSCSCGNELADDDVYCTRCGERL